MGSYTSRDPVNAVLDRYHFFSLYLRQPNAHGADESHGVLFIFDGLFRDILLDVVVQDFILAADGGIGVFSDVRRRRDVLVDVEVLQREAFALLAI